MTSLIIKSLPTAASLVLLLGFVSESRLNAMLDNLSQYSYSRVMKIGAMCYISVPDEENFYCSVCGKATLYDSSYYYEIISARTFLKEIKAVQVDVEDKGFCNHCYPKDAPHTFKLTVFYTPSGKPSVYNYSPDQVLRIKAYLSGAKNTKIDDISEEFLKALKGK